MANDVATVTAHKLDPQTLFKVVTNGDCSALNPDQKLAYYRARCDAAGLDPRAQPFQFIKLSGREVLYALKACTDQLASKHSIVCEIIEQTTEAGIRTVTVCARAKDGRQTDEIGCVTVSNLQGDALCNAYMKAVTKAKRRAVLSLCGLGMTDETELETIPAQPAKPAIRPPQRKTDSNAEADAEAKAGYEAAVAAGDAAIEAATGENEDADSPTIPPDNSGATRVMVLSGEQKPFKRKDGKSSKRYEITVADLATPDQPYMVGTFSDTHFEVAKRAKSQELVALIDVSVNGQFNNLESIAIEEPKR